MIRLALILTACLLLSCDKKSSDKVIGITVMDLGNPFFVELTNAAKEEAKKHGYDVIIFDGDAETQSKQIKDFIIAAKSVWSDLMSGRSL